MEKKGDEKKANSDSLGDEIPGCFTRKPDLWAFMFHSMSSLQSLAIVSAELDACFELPNWLHRKFSC